MQRCWWGCVVVVSLVEAVVVYVHYIRTVAGGGRGDVAMHSRAGAEIRAAFVWGGFWRLETSPPSPGGFLAVSACHFHGPIRSYRIVQYSADRHAHPAPPSLLPYSCPRPSPSGRETREPTATPDTVSV